jgi:tRNA-(ms[2]io[6]A)-hydroxylase
MTISPLKWRTPERWAAQALMDPLTLLSDHAYLERKAASNALELLNRWPEPGCPVEWVHRIAGIARDEALHLDQVLRHLTKRGGKLLRLHRSLYAMDLRGLVRMGRGKEEIVDRLLVTALLEARSCERFRLLAKHCEDRELATFYRRLGITEARHFEDFVALAKETLPEDIVEKRWQDLLLAEAKIIQCQPVAIGIHSGVV